MKQQQQAEQERAVALQLREDDRRWVEQRKSLYTATLAAFTEWVRDVRDWGGTPFPGESAEEAHRNYLARRTFHYRQAANQLDPVMMEVELLAGQSVQGAAEALYAQLIAVEAVRVGDEPPTGSTMLAEVERRFEALKVAMRADLGVAESRAVEVRHESRT
ncbi:hypothetical protein ACLQ3D_20950 [Micromonospora vinacea]|uniref:Uncharacterized protein n=1 Tax=Micromonospora vinacea TaxID=709878 RepID=A0ABS0JTX4_9ACTN|nr:hypothetical protein [Micromonospora vinacea]MBG6099808.1 hypothetical protein [Micromonospora vinacea]